MFNSVINNNPVKLLVHVPYGDNIRVIPRIALPMKESWTYDLFFCFQIVLAATLCLAHASWLPAPVQDTPEVAHAKAAHLAAHAQASTGHAAFAPYGHAGYGGAHYGAPAAGETHSELPFVTALRCMDNSINALMRQLNFFL